MLTKTTLSAIRALIYLGVHGGGTPVSPRRLAEELYESPTYMAKVMRQLVKAAILRAQKGSAGGVVLLREPAAISMLSIVEACQGTILGNFCSEAENLAETCGFHQAAAELHQAIVGVMKHWTLADFLAKPAPSASCAAHVQCWFLPLDTVGAVQPPRRREGTA